MKFVGDDKNINEVSGVDTSDGVPFYLFTLEQEKKQDAIWLFDKYKYNVLLLLLVGGKKYLFQLSPSFCSRL